MRGMSTAIGKGTTSAPEAGVAARQDTERRTSSNDAATRSAKFRAALGEEKPTAHSAFGADRKPGGAAERNKLSEKKDGNQSDLMGRQRGAPAPTGQGGREIAEGKSDRLARPPGLTDEQAMVLGAAGMAEGGTRGARKPETGGGTLAMADDAAAVGGPSFAGVGAGKVAAPKATSGGDDLIAEVAAAVSAAAQAGPAPAWSRPEGPTRPDRPQRELPQPLPGVDPVHQLLIGKRPNGAEARMRISVGPLAGTEIHLREGPGGIQAAILTQNASSRQTLSSAMEAVAQRLKDKGHRLDVRIDGRAMDGRAAFDHGQGRTG
ncbi:MAG TPA: hypothetical protein VGF45_12405 [Polyangia bacterium]